MTEILCGAMSAKTMQTNAFDGMCLWHLENNSGIRCVPDVYVSYIKFTIFYNLWNVWMVVDYRCVGSSLNDFQAHWSERRWHFAVYWIADSAHNILSLSSNPEFSVEFQFLPRDMFFWLRKNFTNNILQQHFALEMCAATWTNIHTKKKYMITLCT